jgi:hypothetical protein
VVLLAEHFTYVRCNARSVTAAVCLVPCDCTWSSRNGTKILWMCLILQIKKLTSPSC